MTRHKHPGSKQAPQNTDPRRTANPPTNVRKSAVATANTAKSPPDSAIPPDKLNAENDK
jgi:hypothetical protein